MHTDTDLQPRRDISAVDAASKHTVRNPKLFGNREHLVESWYWALRSSELKKGKVKPLNLGGRELALYRGQDGKVRCVDAYCPHMGAHFAEGMVKGDDLRCFFHGWTFDGAGKLVDIPCQKKPLDLEIKTWPVEERYGLIWVYTGQTPTHGVFEVPELEGQAVDASIGSGFEKGCHPNIVMVNAIDEQHFTTVHHLPVDLHFDIEERDALTISFENTTKVPTERLFTRIMSWFYDDALTYKMCYRGGSNGSVTVGPDFLHFHVMFALRPTVEGKAEGWTVAVTKDRKGPLGWLTNRVLLFLSKVVAGYFAHGDTRVFQTINWSFQQPIAADRSIIRFIKHLEKMKTVDWKSWSPSSTVDEEDLISIARPQGELASGESREREAV